MALKTIINDPAEVPDALRDFYAKTPDGKFAIMLDGDGDPPPGFVKADKLAELRTNNRKLHAANVELEAKLRAFDGIDPDAARAALAELAETEIVDTEDLDKAHAAELAALQSQLAAEKAAHSATQFKNTVAVEFLKAGGRESAVDFMVGKAADVFAMENGKVTTKEFSTTNPGEKLTVSEWMGQQAHVADFAFKPSRGGGALTSTGSPAKRTISSDPLEVGRNLADIASGDVTVL
jgi:hypothetical protein